MKAHLDWLQNCWGLPNSARQIVSDLLSEELSGCTALKICGPQATPLPDFGKAASEDPHRNTPIVIVPTPEGTFIQSRTFYDAETRIAGHLARLTSHPITAPSKEIPSKKLNPREKSHTSNPLSGLNPEQTKAVQSALHGRLTLLTGGPGTGKTFTIARILAALTTQTTNPQHIHLTAPTGKAADRIKEAILISLAPSLSSPQRQCLEAIAGSSQTLHALLRLHPLTGDCLAPRLAEGATVIVDECSMVDIHLWDRLLNWLPADVRLILAGDPNQLESVGQGAVFADLTRSCSGNPLVNHHIHLTQSHRFADNPSIPQLVRAIEESDSEAVTRLLAANRGLEAASGIAWIEHAGGAISCSSLPESILESLESIASAHSPEAAFSALQNSCILTAQRRFFVGAEAVNEAIRTHLLAKKSPLRYQPIIVNRNDPETGLRNGSTGVLESFPHPQAWFPATTGGLRTLRTDALPDFSPAWALTIHRSQGSEYDQVLVLLPREESPLATRELLYTAITRARKTVFIVGQLNAIQMAVKTPSRRVTLLSDAIKRCFADPPQGCP